MLKNRIFIFTALFFASNFMAANTLKAANPAELSSSSENSLGIFIDPSISLSGGSYEKLTDKVEGSKSFSMLGGITYLIPFSNDKYGWIFGLGYNYDPISFKIEDANDEIINENYNLHYISASPLGILLRTDTIASSDFSIFFKCALYGKFLLSSKLSSSEGRKEQFITSFNKFGLEAGFVLGLEYMVGVETILGLGFGFSHDFINKISKHEDLKSEAKLNYESSKIGFLNFYIYF